MEPRHIDLRLPLVPASVATARRWVERTLASLLDRQKLEDVQLILSELVGNSIRHTEHGAGDELLVRGSFDRWNLHIEVQDEGPGFVPDSALLSDADTGWGLHIVDKLADRWGVAEGQSGVWFEIEVDAPEPRRFH